MSGAGAERVAMEVHGLALDPNTNAPIVVLRAVESGRILPIWVGIVEASAIAFELEKVQVARPMTHDLFLQTVAAMQGQLNEVAIVDLRDNTYFATLTLTTAHGPLVMDARPSDAIALALRAKCPIWCAESVITHVEKAQQPGENKGSESPEEPEGPRVIFREDNNPSFDGLLDKLKDSDFGKYKQ